MDVLIPFLIDWGYLGLFVAAFLAGVTALRLGSGIGRTRCHGAVAPRNAESGDPR